MTTGVTQTLFAQALARLTGLTYTASLAWASAEVGPNNNLGIMPSTSDCPRATNSQGVTYCVYPTPAAGAAAAAALIASSSYYAGIRASVGGTAQQQMDAIARSPWQLGQAGVAAAGGVTPNYASVFKSFGYTPGASATPAPVPARSTTPASSASSSGTTTLAVLLGMPAGTVVNGSNVSQILQAIAGLETSGKLTHAQDQALLGLVGSKAVGASHGGSSFTLGSVQVDVATGGSPGVDPLGVFGSMFPGAPQAAVAAAVLGLVLLLAYSGLEDLLNPS